MMGTNAGLPKRLRALGRIVTTEADRPLDRVCLAIVDSAAPYDSQRGLIAAEIVRRWNAHEAMLSVVDAAREMRKAHRYSTDSLVDAAKKSRAERGLGEALATLDAKEE